MLLRVISGWRSVGSRSPDGGSFEIWIPKFKLPLSACGAPTSKRTELANDLSSGSQALDASIPVCFLKKSGLSCAVLVSRTRAD